MIKKYILTINKFFFFFTITNYKKWAINIKLERRRKKSMLETHYRFVVDTTPSLERTHRDDFNTNAKNCMTTSREATRVVTATTPETN
jgi:hypothetical protein